MTGITNLTNKVAVQVSVSSNGSLLNSGIPVTLKNNSIFSNTIRPSTDTLENLADIEVVDKSNNSSISYNSAVDKYQIKQLNLDGGTF